MKEVLMQEVQYVDDGAVAVFDGRTFRRDKRTGYYLSSKPLKDGKRQRLHIYVWENHNGEIPEGYHIHHKDFDKSNNEIENLVMLSTSEHLKLHGKALTEEQRQKRRDNLITKAIPKSKAWHSSEAGREWHRQNGKKQWENREPVAYECTNCGKPFESLRRYGESDNRFCSNKCKSAYRRKMGYDDVTINCEICGQPFTANKYQKRTRCRECSNKHRRRKQ